MNLKNPKNWIKEIALAIMLIVECIVTYCGFTNNWELEIRIALVFASVLTLFNEILSVLNKFDNQYNELRKAEMTEHSEIKGAIELYKNIEGLETIANFESHYVAMQKESNTEIWIISNSIAEPEDVIKTIYNNLIKGVKYYYVIPNGETWVNDINNISEQLRKLDKKKNLNEQSFAYIQDDLFDLMPTEIVDILLYCNTQSTDYATNMRIFYAFQDVMEDVYYKPADLTEREIHKYFEKLSEWRKRSWIKLI